MLYYILHDLHREQELKCLEETFEVKVEHLEKKLLSAEQNVKKLLLEKKGKISNSE